VRARLIEAVCTAAERLSERRHGALIVLERDSDLTEFQRTGVALHAEVSTQILLTIFWPKTELHDGAVIIDAGGQLGAAAAVLPLSAARGAGTPGAGAPAPKIGTRHRAAIGISEISDAICIVVSEETGRISIAYGGQLTQRLDGARLRAMLVALYGAQASPRTAGRPGDLTGLLERARALFGLRRVTASPAPTADGADGDRPMNAPRDHDAH
jgi:diadenylate cyclase